MNRISFMFFLCGMTVFGQPPLQPPPAQSKPTQPAPSREKMPEEKRLDELERIAAAIDARAAVSSAGHKLAEGDVVEIKVYQEDELNSRARVDGDGMVSMPLLGAIQVGGKTIDQAQAFVRDLLARDYLHFPQVSLTVIELAKKRFSIMGEVNQPGVYAFPEGEALTLPQALAMAGGFTPFARSGKITIKRKANGKDVVLEVNGKAMARKTKEGILEVQPGDSIWVYQSIF
jgi:polysaccharide biosynthesis/export protein